MSRMLTRVGLSGWFLLATPHLLLAQTQTQPQSARDLSNLCMSCHGSRGKAEGVGRVLSGQSADELLTQLRAFRSGARAGTMMPWLVKAFSDEELRAVAQEFARL